MYDVGMRGALAWAWIAAFTPAIANAPEVSLTVVDLTPKFLRFYAAASKPGVTEPERWRLWNELYGFAAVPPTPEGKRMARSMLDQAWPRFASALPEIRKGVDAIHPPPTGTLQQVADLLAATVPIRARLVAAVGDFEGNDFTAPGKEGIPTVAVEVEDPEAGLKLAHEFTHVVEAEQSGVSLDWTRSIAQTIFVEGFAMRATQALQPGKPDAQYVGEVSPNWFARCTDLRQEILRDLRPHLTNSDSDTVMRYTMGKGGAGVEREAYYAGWLVVGDLLQAGWTFPKLARVQESEMAPLVDASLGRLLSERASSGNAPPH
jgi:hypothetical protein